MMQLFQGSSFNGDISRWNVGRVTDFQYMFDSSAFNGDISAWDTSSAEKMAAMFRCSKVFQGDISQWDVSRVESFQRMFFDSPYQGCIAHWNWSPSANMENMFSQVYLERRTTPSLYHWQVVVAEGIESLGHPHLRQFLTEQKAMLDLMCDSNEQRARVLNTMWSQAHGGPVLQEMELPNLDFPDAFS